MKVKKIFISAPGDPSTGITGEDAEIIAPGEFLFDTSLWGKWDTQGLREVREALQYAFGIAWGDDERDIKVTFDFERAREEAQDG